MKLPLDVPSQEDVAYLVRRMLKGRVPPRACELAAFLLTRFERNAGCVQIGYKALAESFGADHKNVRQWLRQLMDAGAVALVEKGRTGAPSVYSLAPLINAINELEVAA